MTTYTANVYAADGGFEYDILQDGVRSIHQDFDPNMPGFVPMDQATATSRAAAVVLRLQNADLLPLLLLQQVGAQAALDKAIFDGDTFGNPPSSQALVATARTVLDTINAQIAAAQP